jgi:2,4-dienoyl-CoA reductase-like NADH-dependent reductase (Old Yellow Enzyme family)
MSIPELPTATAMPASVGAASTQIPSGGHRDVQGDLTEGGNRHYPNLFSEWKLRDQTVRNRIVFPPTCATWVNNGLEGVFTDMATAYYEERARGGVGLILIGATHVHPSSLEAPLATAQLFNDRNIEPLSRIADAVHKHGTKLGIQLWHSGMRGAPGPKMLPDFDEDATWHTVAPSQVPLGEFPGGGTPKELSTAEIEEIIDAYASAAGRAIAAGLDGVEFHLSHGYLGWQFLSPLYNKRTDEWGGSYENRLRFPLEVLRRVRATIGDDAFLGYRINSTSFWPNDLEIDDVTRIVVDIEKQADVDYVSVSAGVHHAFIHTPMHFEAGWEKGYARAIKEVSSKPVFLVGRITTPEVAEQLLQAGDGDAILLARQLFADPEWAVKAAQGRSDDIRQCVAANHCWKMVSLGARVQCIYNPTVGREAKWGAGTLLQVQTRKKVLVVGAGPAGLEYARVASARGHAVTILEKEDHPGGHVHLRSQLPGRGEYKKIADWLSSQAVKNGAELVLGVDVTADTVKDVLARYSPDHVVVATGSRVCADGFQGWTGAAIPGHEHPHVVGWDAVVKGDVRPSGNIVVLDDMGDVVAPLLASQLADEGNTVTIITRWPMVGMDTVLDVYLDWLLPKLYASGVNLLPDHFVSGVDGNKLNAYNVYDPETIKVLDADWTVMTTGRQSVNDLHEIVAAEGVSVETIGDAVAPRSAYEATYEGHRQGRKI